MNTKMKVAASALLGLAGMMAAASTASAAVVCNADRVCWHVRDHYNYRPEFGLVVHENNWRAGPHDHYTWREHRGRGYWNHGHWTRF